MSTPPPPTRLPLWAKPMDHGMSDPEHSHLRVWNIINPTNPGYVYHVFSPEQGAELIEALANEQLGRDDVHSNAFGLEVYDEISGTWDEWEDEEGRNIDDTEFSEEDPSPPGPRRGTPYDRAADSDGSLH